MKMRIRWICVLFIIGTLVSSCIYKHTALKTIDMPSVQKSINLSVRKISKIHLDDGSMILFEQGFQIKNGKIIGSGKKYNLSRQDHITVSEIQMSDVKSIIYYEKKFQLFPLIFALPSFLLSYLAIIHILND